VGSLFSGNVNFSVTNSDYTNLLYYNIITRICVDVCLCTVQLNKMFTIAVIQPDVVADDKMDLILEKVNVFFCVLFQTLSS